jgi:adenylate cyclase
MFKFKNKNIKKFVFGLIVAFGVITISILLVLMNPVHNWHLKLSNTLFSYDNPSEDIVIVAIDETTFLEANKTINKVDLTDFKSWQRSFYADVIQKINQSNAKTIGVDILFIDKSHGLNQNALDDILQNDDLGTLKSYYSLLAHPQDIILAETIAKTTNVILGASSKMPINENNWNQIPLPSIEVPLTIIDEANQNPAGLLSLDMDEDGVIRRVPLYIETKEGYVQPSFGLAIAQIATDDGIDIEKVPLEDGFMRINYFGEPYSFKTISFSSVFSDSYNPEDFENKIVLIGVTTELIPDHHLTPTNVNAPTPGVEIHANIIQTLIDGKFLANQTASGQILMIAGISAALAIALNFLGIWVGILLAIAALAAYTGAAHISYRNGYIINMVYPYIAIILTYFGSIIYKYFAELKRKAYIKHAFGRYLSPTVMETVLDNPRLLHPGGTKHNVTVFFSDIAGFTSISEILPTKDLLQLINEYLSTMTNIVLKHEGTLDKYVGDAIMAYFGAPLDQPDHEKRACEVALEMRAALPALQAKWKYEGKPYVDFRVGINTGEVIIGNVGSEERFDYTIMGDEVNLGSRLEGANKNYGTHIMISESTKMRVENDYVVRKLDYIRVKGKSEPIRVYELVGRKGQVSEIGMKLVNIYKKGIDLYVNRKFKEAYDAFKQALEIYPEDNPSKLYLQRCDVLMNFPPPPEWDAVFTMKTK